MLSLSDAIPLDFYLHKTSSFRQSENNDGKKIYTGNYICWTCGHAAFLLYEN